MMKTRLTAVAAVSVVSLFSASSAFAAPTEVDHSQERVTIDGAASAKASSTDVCSALATASGEVPCFSSADKLAAEQLKALKAGEVPPGYGALPPADQRAQEIATLEKQLASGTPIPTKPAGAATDVAARDAYDCSNGGTTYMYRDSGWNGGTYSASYTGANNWANLTAGIDNAASSFWARAITTSRWHDYANGGGAYYGNGNACRQVENLTNASMTDNGTANDRFSSYASW